MRYERALPPLDLSESSSQVANNWRKWKRAFDYYAEGKGLENMRKKTSKLLRFAGMEVQDIFEDLVDSDPTANEDPYAVCIRKLDNHFRTEENVPFERHVFRQLAPTEGEPVNKFVVRFRTLSFACLVFRVVGLFTFSRVHANDIVHAKGLTRKKRSAGRVAY